MTNDNILERMDPTSRRIVQTAIPIRFAPKDLCDGVPGKLLEISEALAKNFKITSPELLLFKDEDGCDAVRGTDGITQVAALKDGSMRPYIYMSDRRLDCREEAICTLAHEMRHVWQVLRKGTWHGAALSVNIDYWHDPAEVDADGYAIHLLKKAGLTKARIKEVVFAETPLYAQKERLMKAEKIGTTKSGRVNPELIRMIRDFMKGNQV